MSEVDDLINRWLGAISNARTAYQQDPQFHADMRRMRRLLETMELAMTDENIADDVRRRILRAVVFGGPDETAAIQRINEREELIKAVSVTTPGQFPWGAP